MSAEMQLQQVGSVGPVSIPRMLSSGSGHRPLTEREAHEIIEIDDPVVRNLRITLGYHDILIGMTELIGARNVSWCAFGCWASLTAGRFIRKEYIPELVQKYLFKLEYFHKGLHAMHRLLTRVRRDERLARSLLTEVVERVSRQITHNIGWGNHLVFTDLAPIFARMMRMFRGATSYDQAALDRFLATFEPGPVEDNGQDLLIAGFANYYRAMFEDGAKAKAELVLLANLQVGLHEQTRLQTPIVRSINAPIADLIAAAARERAHELTHRRFHRPLDRTIDRMLQPLSAWLQREWQAVATEWMVDLQLPDGKIDVGKDVPPRCEHRMFPTELTRIDNAELAKILYQLDRTPDDTEGSAAENWGLLADRMNYLVDLFRTRQQDSTLFTQPFSDEQIEVIRAGGVPTGPL